MYPMLADLDPDDWEDAAVYGEDFARIQVLEDDREKSAWAVLGRKAADRWAGESLLMTPGEIYWADQATGRRPVVIVSPELEPLQLRRRRVMYPGHRRLARRLLCSFPLGIIAKRREL